MSNIIKPPAEVWRGNISKIGDTPGKDGGEIISMEERVAEQVARHEKNAADWEARMQALLDEVHGQIVELHERVFAERQAGLDTTAAERAIDRLTKRLQNIQEKFATEHQALEEMKDRLAHLQAHRARAAM